MTPFSCVHHCGLGASGHLSLVGTFARLLHDDARRRYWEAPRGAERERLAEEQSRYRDLMDRTDLARLVCRASGISR